MSNVAKLVVPLVLLAAIAGGAAYYLTQEQDAPPVVPPTVMTPSPEPQPTEVPVVVSPPVVTQDPVRTAATGGNSQADAPQGVRGRVLLPTGGPAAGVPVMLLENAMNDMAQIFLNNRLGRLNPPIATATTADDGTFALGLRKLGKSIDLRVVSPEHPEFSRQQIKVREGDWYDAGDIPLELGLVVQGRVIEMHDKSGIANATVYMASSHQSHSMVAAPGRERGTPTMTDANGAFRFTNAPRTGLVNLSAEAPNYASSQLLNQQLKQDAPNEFTLELELGQPIAGVVVDQDGKPIGGVTINANGISRKTPQQATTTSDSDGNFEFASLRTGPYQLATVSTQFAEAKVPLALTGETEVKIVLTTRGTVKLKVLAANKQPVKAYRVSLKRYFAQNPDSIANVLDYGDRSINPGDYPRDLGGEWALVKGLPAGDFRFQISDSTHAKSLSEPFTIVEGSAPVEVVATLTLGGTITGTVIDDRGQPIADATVSTDMNGGLAADTGLFEIFRSMMPEKHSKASAKTDAQGRFRINKLAFAEYMIRASHPSYCEGSAINLKLLNEGQQLDAGVIQLALGTVVEGVTMVGGLPTGQIKVTISTPMSAESLPTAQPGGLNPAATPGPARMLFNATVQSDGDGRFKLLKRVPPGTYKAHASRPGNGGDPFGALMDMRETEQQVVIGPGQETLSLTFNLSKR